MGRLPGETTGTLYTAPFVVSASSTVRAMAYLSGWYDSPITTVSYILQPTPAAFSPAGGVYTAAQSVTLTTTGGASIYYTVNGAAPACGTGILYSGPVLVAGTPNVTTTATIRAIACKTGWSSSAAASAAYTITGTAGVPLFSLAQGTYATAQSVSLSSSTVGASIRYTLDGSTPTETLGTVYSGPILLNTTPNVTTITAIRAIAYESGWADSGIAAATYTITGTVAAPVFSPAAGTYTAQQSISISTATPGATIRYTLDGSAPSETQGTVYVAPVLLTAQSTTVRAIAYQAGWLDSTIAPAAYYYTTPTGGSGGGTQGGGGPGSGGPGTGQPNADSGNGLDPRRVGVRALGTYWGAAGEQVDTTSGNLNFALPLLNIRSRGGWSLTAMLNYNSQMWRQDAAGTWLMGYDVGYGLGWQLQIGSLLPVWGGGQIDHYIYTDATGAEYALYSSGNNIWTSTEGVYLTYDANQGWLYQTDGSFRVMGSVSSAGEQDAGAMYPTLIMDSNGNYISIVYAAGVGSGGAANTSARQALANHDCAGLFSGKNVIDPISASAMDSGRINYSFGSATSLFGPTQDAQTSGSGLRLSLVPFGTYYANANTTFNTVIWDNQDTSAQLADFLHELGHDVSYLSVGMITGGFVQNDRNSDVNNNNNNLIHSNCIKPLNLN